jgi:hypothetical protein
VDGLVATLALVGALDDVEVLDHQLDELGPKVKPLLDRPRLLDHGELPVGELDGHGLPRERQTASLSVPHDGPVEGAVGLLEGFGNQLGLQHLGDVHRRRAQRAAPVGLPEDRLDGRVGGQLGAHALEQVDGRVPAPRAASPGGLQERPDGPCQGRDGAAGQLYPGRRLGRLAPLQGLLDDLPGATLAALAHVVLALDLLVHFWSPCPKCVPKWVSQETSG